MKDLVICILDYKHGNNALRWYDFFKNYYTTYLINTSDIEKNIDSFNREDNNIIKCENIQFGGSVLKAYDLAIENESKWLLYITADVEISDENIVRLHRILKEEILDNEEIGCYGITSLLGSSVFGSDIIAQDYNTDMICNYSNRLREANIIEDWFLLCRTEHFTEALSKYIIREETTYGWGIADAITYISKSHGYRNVYDDRIRAYHPYTEGDSYSRENAYNERKRMSSRLGTPDFLRFTGEVCLDNFYRFQLDDKEFLFPKNIQDKEKYVVCTCAKNEDDYIREWVQHYLDLGFDKIIIADNNDERRITPLLHDYIRDEKVEVINCHGINQMQLPFYNQFVREGNYKWCAYYDCDEFLELTTAENIKELLNKQTADVVIFNWITYGFDGKAFKTEGGVQERFKNPLYPLTYQKENMFIKSIVRGDHNNRQDSYFISAHTIKNENGLKYSIGGYYEVDYASETHLPKYKKAYIKHYYTKSLEEWYGKANRGWADGTSKLLPMATAYYMDNVNIPIDSFAVGPFIRGIKSLDYKGLDEYSFIKVTNINHNVYSFIYHVMSMYAQLTNKALCFDFEQIDESLFNLFLEFAIKTGNKCLTIDNDTDLWALHLRLKNDTNPTYYILDCL